MKFEVNATCTGCGKCTKDCPMWLLKMENGKPVVRQAITAEMRLLGVEPKLKGTLEGYTNGTAGVIVTQGLGIVRATGV